MVRVLPGSMLGFFVDRGIGYRVERVEGSGFPPYTLPPGLPNPSSLNSLK